MSQSPVQVDSASSPMNLPSVVMFPGQGSQSHGMLSDLLLHPSWGPSIQETLREASSILGWDVLAMMASDPRLHETEYAQPVLLASSLALWRLWQHQGGATPDFWLGHSLGEYSALVASGALSFSEGLLLVRERGRCMKAAVEGIETAMLAVVGLDDTTLEACIDSLNLKERCLEIANDNAEDQRVLAGHRSAIDEVSPLLKAKGARLVKRLEVRVPSHCALMKPALKHFAPFCDRIHFLAPSAPLIHNMDACTHSDPKEIPALLKAQLTGRVRFRESLLKLSEYGVRRFIECGPGRVLQGLVRRTLKDVQTEGMESLDFWERHKAP